MTTNNHPAHGPVSLERLHQISEILSKAAAQSDGGNLGYAMADAVKVIDGVISVFGNAPVAVNDDMAYAFHHALSDASLGADEVEEIKTGLRAALANVTAQPAPVVPEVMADPDESQYGGTYDEDYQAECAYVEGCNACRAAMLQAGNSPVTPDGWIPVSEKMPPNKPGSYEYIVFDSLNNRAHHDYWNVPDGSCDDFSPFWNHYGKYVTHWMPLPAAPQQEVKS
ncbi:TPA: DUF551 domain-containing protein [Citrobacter freundii]